MKLKIKRTLLLDGLNKVSHALSTKNLVPVLGGIKFDLKKKKLVLTASDNDITIEYIIVPENDSDFVVDVEGSVVIQGKYILDIVRKVTGEYINIEVIDSVKIIILCENSEFNLNGISVEEYPNINFELSKKFITLSVKDIKEIVSQTCFATATNEESKPVLTGINFNIDKNIVEVNATDSYRLARKQIILDEESSEKYSIVIPSKNLLEFSKIIDNNEDLVEVHIFSNKVLFKLENLKFITRLINGTYPNVSNLIPLEYTSSIELNINLFYEALDRVSVLSADKEKNTITIETFNDYMILKSSSLEVGRVEEKMFIPKLDNNIRISFSAKYMLDALRSFDGDTVIVNFIGEIKPIILNKKDDSSLIQLVLPIRTY